MSARKLQDHQQCEGGHGPVHMHHVEFFAVAMRDWSLTIASDDLVSSALAALDWLTM